MNRTMTISYQNRQGRTRDLVSVPKIIIANKSLSHSGFSIGNKISIEYLPNQIIIRKLTKTL